MSESQTSPENRPPTLQDVAEAAGLSTASVSMALRGRAGVSTKTRERVRAIAEEMGYRPNPTLAALVARRTRSVVEADTIVAVITSDRVDPEKPPKPGILADLHQIAPGFGYRPKAFQVTEPEQYAPLLRNLYYQGVTALILYRAVWTPGCGGDAWKDFSIVHCQPLHDLPPVHTLRSAIYRKTVQISHKVEARGYRQVGQVVMVHDHKIEHPDDSSRLAAALEGFYRHKGQWPEPLVLEFSLRWEEQQREIQEYAKSTGCDAMVVSTDAQAQTVLDLARDDRGKRPPLGVAVIFRGEGSPHLCGMRNNGHQLAEQAVAMLDQQVRTNRKGLPEVPVDVVVPTLWHEGTSLPDRTTR